MSVRNADGITSKLCSNWRRRNDVFRWGLTKVQKGLIIAGAIACGAALTVALVYGQIALAAKIMGFTFKKMAKKMGAKAVAGVVASSLGVSTTVTFAALNFLL